MSVSLAARWPARITTVFLGTMSVFLGNQTHAIYTDYAQIRSFFRSLFGLSPMNADMSVFMVHSQCSRYMVSVHVPHGHCSL